MPKPYDASGKHLFDLGPADWLAVAGLPVPPLPAAVTVVDADLSTVTAAPDKLVRVDAGPASYLVVVDFQAGPDASLDPRVMMYNAIARWRHGLPARSVVFLLRPQALTRGVTGRVVDRVDADVGLDFAYRLVRVWELPVEPLLTGPLGTLPLAPVAAVPRADLPAVLGRVRQRLAAEPPAARPADLWKATQILVTLRYSTEVLETIMYDLLQNPPEGTAAYDLLKRGEAQGEAIGEARGEAIGEARGEARGRATLVVELATDRFGPPAEADRARVMAMTDRDELRRLAARLPAVSGWAELLGG